MDDEALQTKFYCKICHPDKHTQQMPHGPSKPERDVYMVLSTDFRHHKIAVESVMHRAKSPKTKVDVTLLGQSRKHDLLVMVDGKQHTGEGYGGSRKTAVQAASDQNEADNKFNNNALHGGKYLVRIHHIDAAMPGVVRTTLREALKLQAQYWSFVMHSPTFQIPLQASQHPHTHHEQVLAVA